MRFKINMNLFAGLKLNLFMSFLRPACQKGTSLQSGNKNPKAGQEWEQSGDGARTPEWGKNGNKVGTRTPKWDKHGNKVGTRWEQSGNKVGTRTKWDKNKHKVGTNYKQSGDKNAKVGQEWEQSGNKVEAKTQSGTRMGTK